MAFGELGFSFGFGGGQASGPPVTRLEASISAFPESSGAGVLAATLAIVGDDYVGPDTYVITSDPSGLFEIVNGNEILTSSGASFDYETTSSFPIEVEGTDTGTATVYSKTVYAQVSNVNEAPTAIALSANTIVENLENTFIGTFTATDVDAGDTANFAVTVDTSGLFEVRSGNQIWIKAGVSAEYETATSHGITVQVTDGGALTFSDTFTINVGDANEAPTDISLNATTISEDAEIGDTIATISSSGDPDAGDTATYTIINDPDDKFLISGTDLKVNGALDYATDTSHNVTIRVTDSGGLFYDEPATIDVIEAASGFDLNALPTLLFNLDGELSAIITSTGNQVVDFDDLGPSDNDATQPISSRQPLTGGSLNGLNALMFDSVDDRLLVQDSAVANFSVFVAMTIPTLWTDKQLFGNSQVSLTVSDSPIRLSVKTSAGFQKSTYEYVAGVPFVFGVVGSHTGGGTFYANGSVAGTWTGTLTPNSVATINYGDQSWKRVDMIFGQCVYFESQLTGQTLIDVQDALLKWMPS